MTEKKVPAFLYRIAVRKVVNHHRVHGRQKRLLDGYVRQQPSDAGLDSTSPGSWLLREEQSQAFQNAFQTIHCKDRELLMLKYTEGWGYRELADHLGVSIKTIEYRFASGSSGVAGCNKSGRRSIIDPIEIQRLVDGELPSNERLLLLKQVDSEPRQWRTIALAFLEDQAFRDSVRIANTSSGPGTSTESVQNSATITLAPTLHKETHGPQEPRRWLLAASLAATVFLAVGIAVGRSSHSIDSGATSNPSNQIAQADPSKFDANKSRSGLSSTFELTPKSDSEWWGTPVGELTFASDGSPAQMHSTDPLKLEERPSSATNPRIPIYEVRAEQAQRWISEETQRTKAWREELRRRGYELDTQPQRIEKQLPDGRALIIPINQWNVRPWGQ